MSQAARNEPFYNFHLYNTKKQGGHGPSGPHSSYSPVPFITMYNYLISFDLMSFHFWTNLAFSYTMCTSCMSILFHFWPATDGTYGMLEKTESYSKHENTDRMQRTKNIKNKSDRISFFRPNFVFYLAKSWNIWTWLTILLS